MKVFSSSTIIFLGSLFLTFAAVDATTQRKLISIDISGTDDARSTKLAALGDQDGLLNVEFIEPEEGIIFVLGTEKEASNRVDAVEASAAASSSTSSSLWIQALNGEWSLDNNHDMIDPVLLYQQLSGLPAPQRLQEANERRKTHVFPEPLELPPLDDAEEDEEHDNTVHRRFLQNDSGNGACDAAFWETKQCGYEAHTVNFCYCYSCRTGTGAVGGDAVNMFVRAQTYRGSTVTQRVKFWRCDPASGRDCRYKTLVDQTVSHGTIVSARGIGNGQLLTVKTT
jgi:hypothetical protein